MEEKAVLCHGITSVCNDKIQKIVISKNIYILAHSDSDAGTNGVVVVSNGGGGTFKYLSDAVIKSSILNPPPSTTFTEEAFRYLSLFTINDEITGPQAYKAGIQ